MVPALREFLSALMRHDPMQRPSDANELRGQLDGLRKKTWGRAFAQEEWQWRSPR